MKKIVSIIFSLLVSITLIASSTVVSFAEGSDIDSVAKAVEEKIAGMTFSNSSTANDVMIAVRSITQDKGANTKWSTEFAKADSIGGIKDVVPGVNGACAGVIEIELGGATKKVSFNRPIIAKEEKRDYTKALKEDFDIMDGILISYNGDAELVVVPNEVKEIDQYCFAENETIKALVLPEGIEAVGMSQFKGMKNLEAISLPESLISLAAAGDVNGSGNVFKDCEKLKYVKLSSKMTELPSNTFYNTALDNFIIGPNVTLLGNFCFYLCNFENAFVPTNIKTIGQGVWGQQRGEYGKESLKTATFINPTMVYEYDLGVSDPICNMGTSVDVKGVAGSTTETYVNNHNSTTPAPKLTFASVEPTLAEVVVNAQRTINWLHKDSDADQSVFIDAVNAQSTNKDITAGWLDGYTFDGEKASGQIAVQSSTDSITIDLANAYGKTASADKNASDKDSSGSAKTETGSQNSNNTMIIVIISAAAIIVIIAVIIIILLMKKMKTTQAK